MLSSLQKSSQYTKSSHQESNKSSLSTKSSQPSNKSFVATSDPETSSLIIHLNSKKKANIAPVK